MTGSDSRSLAPVVADSHATPEWSGGYRLDPYRRGGRLGLRKEPRDAGFMLRQRAAARGSRRHGAQQNRHAGRDAAGDLRKNDA